MGKVRTVADSYFDIDIGNRLREARIDAGLTQTALASSIGVSFQQLQKYENASNRLPANRYPLLAKAIGFDATDLLFGQKDSAEHFYTSQREREILMLYRKIPEEKRQIIIEVMKSFAAEVDERLPMRSRPARG